MRTNVDKSGSMTAAPFNTSNEARRECSDSVVIQLARFANSHPVYIVMLVFESLCLVLSVCLYCVVLGRSFCTERPRPLVPAFIEGLV